MGRPTQVVSQVMAEEPKLKVRKIPKALRALAKLSCIGGPSDLKATTTTVVPGSQHAVEVVEVASWLVGAAREERNPAETFTFEPVEGAFSVACERTSAHELVEASLPMLTVDNTWQSMAALLDEIDKIDGELQSTEVDVEMASDDATGTFVVENIEPTAVEEADVDADDYEASFSISLYYAEDSLVEMEVEMAPVVVENVEATAVEEADVDADDDQEFSLGLYYEEDSVVESKVKMAPGAFAASRLASWLNARLDAATGTLVVEHVEPIEEAAVAADDYEDFRSFVNLYLVEEDSISFTASAVFTNEEETCNFVHAMASHLIATTVAEQWAASANEFENLSPQASDQSPVSVYSDKNGFLSSSPIFANQEDVRNSASSLAPSASLPSTFVGSDLSITTTIRAQDDHQHFGTSAAYDQQTDTDNESVSASPSPSTPSRYCRDSFFIPDSASANTSERVSSAGSTSRTSSFSQTRPISESTSISFAGLTAQDLVVEEDITVVQSPLSRVDDALGLFRAQLDLKDSQIARLQVEIVDLRRRNISLQQRLFIVDTLGPDALAQQTVDVFDSDGFVREPNDAPLSTKRAVPTIVVTSPTLDADTFNNEPPSALSDRGQSQRNRQAVSVGTAAKASNMASEPSYHRPFKGATRTTATSESTTSPSGDLAVGVHLRCTTPPTVLPTKTGNNEPLSLRRTTLTRDSALPSRPSAIPRRSALRGSNQHPADPSNPAPSLPTSSSGNITPSDTPALSKLFGAPVQRHRNPDHTPSKWEHEIQSIRAAKKTKSKPRPVPF
uniref:Uncharacterized protein n=1 Tax=Mycena chlorophos TaxID=658473 RepID=A0ABQ0LNH6_MYCCL|nr:predicted protein [Mycena chlorophos]